MGFSLEVEARGILTQALGIIPAEIHVTLTIHNCFQSIGFDAQPIPLRQPIRNVPEFGK